MFIWHSFHLCSFDWIQWDCIWWIFHVLQANRWKMLSIYNKKNPLFARIRFQRIYNGKWDKHLSRIIKFFQTLWKQIGSSGSAWLDASTTALFFVFTFLFFKSYWLDQTEFGITKIMMTHLLRMWIWTHYTGCLYVLSQRWLLALDK